MRVIYQDALDVDRIPEELRDRPQWVVWRIGTRRDGDQPTKLPYDPRTGKLAKANDPTTWSTFDVALDAYQREQGRYEGVGYEFSEDDGFVGIDLDGCRDPDTGRLEQWADDILETLDSYWEISPSKTGVKIWARGKLPTTSTGKKIKLTGKPVGDKDPGIEMYQRGRYFAMTGWSEGDPVINDCQAQIDRLWITFIEPPKPATPDPTNGQHKSNGHAPDALERCWAYVSRMDPAISGQGGSDRTFAAAAKTFEFGMSMGQAMEIMRRYNAHCEPPWSESELEHKLTDAHEKVTAAGGIGKMVRDERSRNKRNGAKKRRPKALPKIDADDLLSPAGQTEMANARRLAARYGEDIRWCDPWQKWFVWDGRRWKQDDARRVDRLAKRVSVSLWKAVGELADEVSPHELEPAIRFAKVSSQGKGIREMLSLARSEDGLAVVPESMDADPWILNVMNGTVDLKTGDLRPHNRDELLSCVAPVEYHPDAKAPNWIAFLNRILDGQDDIASYLQHLVGASITGSSDEHILPVMYGTGANGKSTFIKAIQKVLGPDYFHAPKSTLLMARTHEQHPTELATLFRKRFVSTVETEQGHRLNEPLIKQLTGGDRIAARRMREDFWEFDPTHTIWLAANHKPTVRGNDEGIWRRLKLIPFTVVIPPADRDKFFYQRCLKPELPGILAWAVRGCLAWQRGGLSEPDAVRAATMDYRTEMDSLGQFIGDRCIVHPNAEVGVGELYQDFKSWCDTNKEYLLSKRRFGMALTERGFSERKTTGGSRLRTGIGLKVAQVA